MDTDPSSANAAPAWYRQFWPWFLFGLPAAVVVAGLATWWIAERHADHLVVDDYYREGLAINRELGRRELAAALNVRAQLEIRDALVRIRLEGESRPAALALYLSHPVDAGRDLRMRLARVSAGTYEAPWTNGDQRRWLWRLEPLAVAEAERWRVDGEIAIAPTDGY